MGINVGTAVIVAESKSNKEVMKLCKVTVKGSVSSTTKTQYVPNGSGYSQTITLGGKKFNIYQQGWYYNSPYNSVNNYKMQTIASTGCGPTSVAIILSGYGCKESPAQIGQRCLKNSIPSSLESMEKEVRAMGRNTIRHQGYNSNYEYVYKLMRNALAMDHQIVLYVGGGTGTDKPSWKQFTNSGAHFISVLGIDLSNDKVFVGNPNGMHIGWNDLSTVVKARGSNIGSMIGWIEIY